jgi:hypothetical protein
VMKGELAINGVARAHGGDFVLFWNSGSALHRGCPDAQLPV